MPLNIIRIIIAFPAVLFITFSLRWLLNPAGIAPDFGMPLLNGVGLSTQVGDFFSVFMMLGLAVLAGIISRQRIWFYPPVIFLALAATGRILAWGLHSATLAVALIIPEIIIAALWYFGSGYICKESA